MENEISGIDNDAFETVAIEEHLEDSDSASKEGSLTGSSTKMELDAGLVEGLAATQETNTGNKDTSSTVLPDTAHYAYESSGDLLDSYAEFHNKNYQLASVRPQRTTV